MDDIFRWLAWYAALTVSAGLGLPIAVRCLNWLPDRGLTFARPLGLLAIGLLYWVLGLLGWTRPGAVVAVVAMLGIAGVSALALRQAGWATFAASLRVHARPVLVGEVIFLLAFAGGAWLRAQHPDILATEKPVEFMMLNAVLQSASFPPHDPWLAGHLLHADTFGYILIAWLAQVTATPTAVAFNLGLAATLALAAGAVYAIVANLVESLVSGSRQHPDKAPALAPLSSTAVWAADLAPLVILLAGNLYGVLALLHANGILADATIVAPHVSYALSDGSAGTNGAETPAVSWGSVNVWTWLDTQGISGPPPGGAPERITVNPGFWWWYQAARVINDRDLTGRQPSPNVQHEFPAFSFVLGDLTPHALSLPYALLALGVALHAFRKASGSDSPTVSPSWLMLSGLVISGLGLINRWDLPTYGALVWAAPMLGRAQRAGWRRALSEWPGQMLSGILLVAIGLALHAPAVGIGGFQGVDLAANLTYPTRFQHTLVAFSHSLWIAALFLIGLVWTKRVRVRWPMTIAASATIVIGLVGLSIALAAPSLLDPVQVAGWPLSTSFRDASTAHSLLTSRRLLDSWSTVLPALGLGVCVSFVWSARPPSAAVVGQGRPSGVSDTPPALIFAVFLVAVGLLLVLIPEWLYLRDGLGTRADMVLKFYYQAWLLWGVGGWAGVWWLWHRRHAEPARRAGWRSLLGRIAARAGFGVTILLIGAGLVYTGLAAISVATMDTGPATLDGMAYFGRTFPDDRAGIQWLADHAEPDSIIVEGVSGDYWADGVFSRMSMATGLQAVLGWPGYARQWPGADAQAVRDRESDIARLYVTDDPGELVEILERYGVSYVVIGSIEQSRYGIPADAAILSSACDCLEQVFHQGSVTIYRFSR